MKGVHFLGSSLADLRRFPAEARRDAGFQLHAVQRGLEPRDWKPIPSVGAGATEIRIHVLGEWRAIYVARLAETVYVLHCFEKKSRKIRREDLALARQRYRLIG
jgi:phage-related protein